MFDAISNFSTNSSVMLNQAKATHEINAAKPRTLEAREVTGHKDFQSILKKTSKNKQTNVLDGTKIASQEIGPVAQKLARGLEAQFLASFLLLNTESESGGNALVDAALKTNCEYDTGQLSRLGQDIYNELIAF